MLMAFRVYMISNIRGNGVTSGFGDHLQHDCGNADGVDWSNVQDQQIPDALQVQQSTGKPVGAGTRRVLLSENGVVGIGVGVLMGGLGVWTVLRKFL